jgi:hypothetical protein
MRQRLSQARMPCPSCTGSLSTNRRKAGLAKIVQLPVVYDHVQHASCNFTRAYLEKEGESFFILVDCDRKAKPRYTVMASFTRIEENESSYITIHPSHKIAKINDNIYGGFTE